MNNLATQVTPAARSGESLGVASALRGLGSDDSVHSAAGAGGNPGSTPALTVADLHRLLALFEFHSGFVPGFELTAEEFDIFDLLRRGVIDQPRSHLDHNCYLLGAKMQVAIKEAARAESAHASAPDKESAHSADATP